MLVSLIAAVVAALCYGVASVMQAVAVREASNRTADAVHGGAAAAVDPGLLPRMLHQWRFVASVVIDTLGFLDLARPVCLVLALIVQALEPGTARAVVGVLVKALPPGSYLVATLGAGDAGRLPDSVWAAGATEADLASFFGGLDLLPPGISRHGEVLSGVGVKPYPGRPRGSGGVEPNPGRPRG